jgi:hypothetical protein
MLQRSRKSDRCYLYHQKGHFAKECPKKKHKSAKLISQLLIEYPSSDIESLYSEQDSADKNTVFAIDDSDTDDTVSLTSLNLQDEDTTSFPIFMSQQEAQPHRVLLTAASQTPHVQVSLLTSKFAKPLKVIGLIDTGAAKTMIKPDFLPPEEWMPSKDRFQATNGESFGTNISKKKIGIKFFPDCVVW